MQSDSAGHTDKLLTEQDLSDYLAIPVGTLQYHRKRGTGIPFVRIGGAVRYRPSDVEKYLAEHRRISTKSSEVPQHAGAA